MGSVDLETGFGQQRCAYTPGKARANPSQKDRPCTAPLPSRTSTTSPSSTAATSTRKEATAPPWGPSSTAGTPAVGAAAAVASATPLHRELRTLPVISRKGCLPRLLYGSGSLVRATTSLSLRDHTTRSSAKRRPPAARHPCNAVDQRPRSSARAGSHRLARPSRAAPDASSSEHSSALPMTTSVA